MTDLRSLRMAVEIVALAILAGRVTRIGQAIVLARKTPWGRAVPILTLKRALVSDGMFTFL